MGGVGLREWSPDILEAENRRPTFDSAHAPAVGFLSDAVVGIQLETLASCLEQVNCRNQFQDYGAHNFALFVRPDGEILRAMGILHGPTVTQQSGSLCVSGVGASQKSHHFVQGSDVECTHRTGVLQAVSHRLTGIE